MNPTYDHNPSDSERTPCAVCVIATLERTALQLGTDNQRERWQAGVLPEEELLSLVRNELYRPFDGVPRWVKIAGAQTIHSRYCREGRLQTKDWETDMTYSAGPATTMPHDDWEAVKQLRERAYHASNHLWIRQSGSAFLVSAREHEAKCKRCGETTLRCSASISVLWAGREIAREYALHR